LCKPRQIALCGAITRKGALDHPLLFTVLDALQSDLLPLHGQDLAEQTDLLDLWADHLKLKTLRPFIDVASADYDKPDWLQAALLVGQLEIVRVGSGEQGAQRASNQGNLLGLYPLQRLFKTDRWQKAEEAFR
jgi:hypothetical protein